MTNITLPSNRDTLLVEVFHLDGHTAFVCGAHGRITYESLGEIEDDLEEMIFDQGDGTYLFEATWIEAQTGEYGRVELPAYWELSMVRYVGIPESR